MRLNLVFAFLFIVVGSLGAIFWKVDSDFYSQKIRSNESQSRVQISAISHSIETEIEGLTQVLDLAYPIISEMKHDYSSDQVFSKFQMIGKLQKIETGEYNFENVSYLQKTPIRSWAKTYTFFALKNLKSENFEKAKVQVLHDTARKPWLLFVVKSSVTQNMYAAILGKDFFQSIVDHQKGQLGTVSILNNSGQVIAHSTAEYVGLDLKEDEIVKEISAGTHSNGSGFFRGLQNEMNHGFYEKLENHDLYVTISTPMTDLMAERSALKKKFIFLGFGVIFIGLALLFFFDSARKNEIDIPASTITTQKAAEVPVVPVTVAPQIKPQQIEEVKMMPPSPVPVENETQKSEFENLFGQRKIAEAFDMIDNLDTPPRKLIEAESLTTTKELPPKQPVIEPNQKIEEIAPIAKPLIVIQRREYKSDQFEVDVRKPGAKL